MSLAELYTKGARVWVADSELVWRGAVLLENYTGQKEICAQYEDGLEFKITVKSPDSLPPLRNPDILLGENDLTSLSYLHEPAVLYNLQVRFCERNYIYTYCGIVLVAINPYYQLPIYDADTIHAYSGQDMASMDPHIFAVAEEAFKRMSRFEENQSLIVSGESGAGKTVSAKYAMRYFATVCGAEAETQIEKRVLASNPIMEAIGNAKTTRNDNSSRFGKYIQIGFSNNNTIIGASMRTYLLEKSRVVFQASDERNYHIFYQLCSVASRKEYESLKLDDPDVFMYTNQGGSPTVDSINDTTDFNSVREALSLMGFTDIRQMDIFRILSGILHLGNVVIDKEDRSVDRCSIKKTDEHLPIMAELLGIDAEQMRHWLCNRKIVTATETVTKPLTFAQAYFSRDALAKHIYSQLFNWIVKELNKSLFTNIKTSKFIGVLDIYGFETFEVNSFEQFCINYANEKLQQQFCLHVFKLEQDEYMREEISWSFIDFYDNQACIDLIEGKLGILDLLDEECKMPSASDSNWRQKLCDMHVNKSKHFEKPRLSQTSFIVSHFADRVEYQMDSFVEKNRDTVLDEHINILKASQYELVSELFQDIPDIVLSPTRRVGVPVRPARELPKSSSQQKQSRKTVGSQFRESLNLLMETLFTTTPHYIRCIKPNDSKQTFTFDPKRAVQQLRACGVLETIRISAAGYPSRWTYTEFFQRYRVLAHSREILRNDMRKTCEKILHKLIQTNGFLLLNPRESKKATSLKDRDKYQFGKTKIFFRAGQVAYLEHLRSERLRGCGQLIQKMVRGWLARRNYAKVRRMVLLVQTHGRGMLARRHALHMKRTQAAIRIQTTWRRYYQQQKYQRMLRAVIIIQSYARGSFGRQQFIEMRANAKAVIIQRIVRGWLERRRYMKVRCGFIKLQAHVRRHAAKKELKRLKVEAKSVEHMKNVARGLENKIIELQQKLTEKNKEVLTLRDDQHQLTEVKLEITKLRTAAQNNKVSTDRIAQLEKIIAQLTAELEQEKQEKETAVKENTNIKKESQQLSSRLSEEKIVLEEELKRVNELIQLKESEFNALLKAKLVETREALMNEFDVERSHHQKLVSDYTRLQQRFENLQDDVQVLTSPSAPTAAGNSPFSRPPQPAVMVGKVQAGDELTASNGNDNGTESRPDSRLENMQPNVGEFDESTTDVALVTRLQLRIKQLEWERTLMQREIDRKENASLHGSQSADEQERDIFEALKVQELEMQQTTALADLNAFRKAIADDNEEFIAKRIKGTNAAQQLINQFEVMQEELARRRDECIQLRTVLATQNRQISELAAGNAIVINEDAELAMAYRSQRDLNKLLENEIQKFQKEAKSREKELHQQIEELKKENTRQQRLISQLNDITSNLTMTPQAKMEATMQHEITRLTSENLDLREEIDKLQDQMRKLKKALKIYAKRLKVTEATEVQEDLEREMATEDENMPAVKHYEQREYGGMFEYNKDDEIQLVKNLIIELKPRLAVQQLPGLPAYILFMCIRHTDYMNNDEKVRSLLTGTINGIKKTVKRHQEDCETLSLWLSNTCRLLHILKQYSGEKVFQVANTPRQNDHCLHNFDLSEYRQILSDLAIWIFQGLIKLNQTIIHPIIVSAVLEHEAIAGLSAGKPTGLRGRATGGARGSRALFDSDDKNKDLSLDQLIKALDGLMRVLTVHSVDPEIIQQIYRQLFYFICANALNNLLLRKDMCHWTKGMQMRYNLSHLEQWLRDNKLQDSNVQQALEPIVQASQLLQARKTDADVDCICEMCSRLTMSQIIKILNLYTPVNEFEERVPISFIRKIQDKLSGRPDSSQTLLMDTKFFFAVTFPFNPSNVCLETVTVPSQWGLGFLKRV